MHEEVGAYLEGKNIHTLLTYGKDAKYISDIGGQFVDHVGYFIDKQQLTQYLINNLG